MKFLITVFVAFVVAFSTAQAADQVYVSSKKVKLYSEANYRSDTLTRLEKGTALDVLDQKGKWMEVRYNALKGWVPSYSVSETEPQKKVSFFNRLKGFFSYDSKRSRTSNISTAGGIRGLAEDEEGASGKKDFAAVEKMEQMRVDDAEVEKFIEGNAR
jgi:uncharacterized protein YgiM (DUF1202 family)